MAAFAARTLGSVRTVTEKRAPAPRAARTAGEPENAESIRTTSVPVHPAAPGGADGFGDHRRGAAGGGSVAAAQPDAGDHRGGQRRADRRGQHVQAAHQQALALDPGMPERRALPGVPADPLLLGVDIDEREDVLARQQRAAAGQLRQDLPVDLLQLEHVPPGERAPGTTQRGRRADIPEQHRHGAVTSAASSVMNAKHSSMPATLATVRSRIRVALRVNTPASSSGRPYSMASSAPDTSDRSAVIADRSPYSCISCRSSRRTCFSVTSWSRYGA